MKRYEAFITKDWRNNGLSNVVVARSDDNDDTVAGFFLVDSFCLGVKDAFRLDDLIKDELREIMERRFPEDSMERMHPAWAKKFIEGAVAYAENLGFAPSRDYRKARRVLSGIDAGLCTETFVYGEDGRPHYMQGNMDDDARAARISALLRSRLGEDGYTVTLRKDFLDNPDISDEAMDVTRKSVLNALKGIGKNFTGYTVAGIITAMLCMPHVYEPADVLNMLTGDVSMDEDEESPDKTKFSVLANFIEIYWVQLEALLEAEMESDSPWPFDFYSDEFSTSREFFMALFMWVKAFVVVTECYGEVWAEALERPDLAQHWKTLRCWAKPAELGGVFELVKEAMEKERTSTDSTAPLTVINPNLYDLIDSIIAIYRVLISNY